MDSQMSELMISGLLSCLEGNVAGIIWVYIQLSPKTGVGAMSGLMAL